MAIETLSYGMVVERRNVACRQTIYYNRK